MANKGFVAVAERTMVHAYASTDVSTHTKIVKLKPAALTIKWRDGAADWVHVMGRKYNCTTSEWVTVGSHVISHCLIISRWTFTRLTGDQCEN